MKRTTLICLAALIALTLAAGCGGGSDEPERPTATTAAAATATAVPPTATTAPARSVLDVVESADSLAGLGDYAAAISEYTELLRLLKDLDATPEDFAVVYMSRGLAYFGLGDYESAIADYDAALEWDPTFAEIYVARAQAYFHLGDEAAMLADLERAEAAGLDMSEFVVGLCSRSNTSNNLSASAGSNPTPLSRV